MASDTPNEAPVQLIFGDSGGIGSEVSCRLAASRATVFLASRPSDRLDELARQLNAAQSDLRFLTRCAIVDFVVTSRWNGHIGAREAE